MALRGFRRHLDSLHPIGQVAELEGIAWGVVYLASDESKFVTGSELVIDGGYTAREGSSCNIASCGDFAPRTSIINTRQVGGTDTITSMDYSAQSELHNNPSCEDNRLKAPVAVSR